MKEVTVSIRNQVLKFLYKNILKRIFFLGDPEAVHDSMQYVGVLLGKLYLGRWFTHVLFGYGHPALEQTVAGIRFKNPVGLSAGFDKDAVLTDILPSVGFGFEEIGSVTGEACEGNEKPRLWRLKKSQSLLVYYGLKNRGAEEISRRLAKKHFSFPVGISVAKTNSEKTVDEEMGIADYGKAFSLFNEKNVGDYFTINISCPNAFGGEPFTDPGKLDRLLAAIRKVQCNKPVFIKMPAELSVPVVDEIISLARKYRITGFICTNLAKDRSNRHIKDRDVHSLGGMSGKVVSELSDNLISYIYRKTKGEFVIIGVGGVFSAEDAYRKIKLGASLIQLITGMIFEGPQLISEINQGLVQLLHRDGYTSIAQAIGKYN